MTVVRTVGAIDGDTFSFYYGRVAWRVRVPDVECAEIRNTARARGQAARLGIGIDSLLRLGERAKSFADSVLTHAPVRLTVGPQGKRFDRYGRLPRTIDYWKNGRWVHYREALATRKLLIE